MLFDGIAAQDELRPFALALGTTLSRLFSYMPETAELDTGRHVSFFEVIQTRDATDDTVISHDQSFTLSIRACRTSCR